MGIRGEILHAGAALADGSVPITLPRDAAREAARRELSDPAYHQDDPSLMQRLFSWVWQQFDRMLDQIGVTGTGGHAGLAVFLGVLLLCAAAPWWRLGAPRRAATTTGPALFDERPRTASAHRTAAEGHAAAGRWADAVRERMRAVVRALEERALLDERPGRTADEAAADAGSALPDHAEALRRAARTFDGITYGGRTAAPRDYREIADLDSALQHAHPARTPGRAPAGAATGPAGTGSGGPA